jgi:tetratricopeptide (TPR) repeat protein
MSDNPRIEELKRRVQQDPASIAFAALADEYRRAGQFHEAIETCRAGLLRHPSYLSARVTLGRALLEIGEINDAETELEQVLRAAPENLAAIRALAAIHHKRGEIPEVASPQPAVAKPGVQTDKPVMAQARTIVPNPALPRLEQFLEGIRRERVQLDSAGANGRR